MNNENNASLKYRVTRGRSEYEKLSKLLIVIFFYSWKYTTTLKNIQII